MSDNHIHKCPKCEGVVFECYIRHREGTMLVLRRQLTELHRRQGHGALPAARNAREAKL